MSDERVLIRDCFNCVHCEWHKAYESCALRTKNVIIYNGAKEALRCNRYEQKKSEVADSE